MRTFDFAPLYRSTVGFDRLFEMIDEAARVEPFANWPPYNIEKTADDQYRIVMAVAGFGADEIDLTQHETRLVVTGQKQAADESAQYLHRGIATRSFKQIFNLADHVKVVAAALENGLLTIDLRREVPEQLKPRRIAIGTGPGPVAQDPPRRQLEHGAEAKAA